MVRFVGPLSRREFVAGDGNLFPTGSKGSDRLCDRLNLEENKSFVGDRRFVDQLGRPCIGCPVVSRLCLRRQRFAWLILSRTASWYIRRHDVGTCRDALEYTSLGSRRSAPSVWTLLRIPLGGRQAHLVYTTLTRKNGVFLLVSHFRSPVVNGRKSGKWPGKIRVKKKRARFQVWVTSCECSPHLQTRNAA